MSTFKIIIPACVLAFSLANSAAAHAEIRPQQGMKSLLDSVSASLADKLEERAALSPGLEDTVPAPPASAPVSGNADTQTEFTVPQATADDNRGEPRVAGLGR